MGGRHGGEGGGERTARRRLPRRNQIRDYGGEEEGFESEVSGAEEDGCEESSG